MDKTSTVEYIENIYGLVTNYLHNHTSLKLDSLRKKLETLETTYELCEDVNKIKKLESFIKVIIDEMEFIINEQ